ncbi:MAG TPA: nucleotidyl transferase AbiEii/AbiGii toxin family protein [Rhodanobacter sp.]|jgi:predicted nucleotidyltransferase component of viral defense system|nr:nucleotidyl transferase AbiEii/AbiGii toxin family protein [Rhodanobacter sp.]
MSDWEIAHWVAAAASAPDRDFRCAVHTIVAAMASDQDLAQASFMKGGILLALRYHSPRYTTDIDFSTPQGYSKEAERKLLDRLARGLALMSDQLGYDLECRITSSRADPPIKPHFTHFWINLKVTIGYARRGTPAHKRLLGQGSINTHIQMDYSFDERVPTEDLYQVDSQGQLQVYALSTLIAEKYRALLQQVMRRRARRQDVFDLHFLLTSLDVTAGGFRKEVLDVLRIKADDRGVACDRESFRNPELISRARRDYPTLRDELDEAALPEFDVAFNCVQGYYEALPW